MLISKRGNLLIQDIDEETLFSYAIENGIIDPVGIRNDYEKMERKKYLEKHNHKVWQTKKGDWKTYFDDEDNPRGCVLRTRATMEGMEELIVKHYRDIDVDPFIDQVFQEWNNQRLAFGEITKQSYSRYLNDFKRFFPPDCLLRQKKFREITENDLEIFIKSTIHDKGLTSKTYSGLRTIIRGAFKYGKSQHYTDLSITAFLGDLELSRKVFVRKRIDKESEIFNEDEVVLIKSYLHKNGKIRDMGILLAFETGLRVGELSTLKKTDIIRERKCIHIQRTEISYKDPDTKKRICEVQNFPKTESGDRYLIITELAINLIDEIIKLNPNDEYLFSENGKRIRSNAFNRRLSRICDDLHIKHRSMHKIRKTYGTTLLDARVDESTVAEQMGHADIATTRRYYYRSNKSDSTKFHQINQALSGVKYSHELTQNSN